jgi:outer membrane protein OmpA-like peptidoglycan-associated protein
LYLAEQALDEANRAFEEEGDTERTRRLAYIAERKVRQADAQANIVAAQRYKADTDRWIQRTTGQQLASMRNRLDEAEKKRATAAYELSSQRDELSRSRDDLEEERRSRVEAERKAEEALTRLDQLGKVQQEERGLVLTLSGSVLFAFDQWSLLPSAHATLDDVAAALKVREETLLVEGHADATGPDSYNHDLSFKRAQAVRDYLVGHGVAPERIRAAGMGEARPVASNATPEGRANNRRVEIVLEREPSAR